LREFKKLLDEGNNLKSIKKMGVSKHLIGFYSNFCQGKINLSKNIFIEEYEKGLSLFDIADKYKISRGDITYLREIYELKKKGATFLHRKKTEIPLTKRQKEILYGSMMGDAKRGSFSSVSFNHGKDQKEYLLWKYKEFESVASPISLKGEKYIDKRSEYEGERWRFYTYANTDIEKCMLEFYKDGKKEINQEILNELTPLSIAVWYQDDGTVDFYSRSQCKASPTFKFCTESFSKENCELIKEWFLNEYNINTELKECELSSGVGYRLKYV
jgi:hypothetical protein